MEGKPMPTSKRRKPKHTQATQSRRFTVGPETPDYNGVLLVWLSDGNTRHEFSSSLWWTGKQIPEIVDMRSRQTGPRIAHARNNLAREFLLTNYEWILYIDTDQYWSTDDLRRLIASADPIERPIMGALIFADQSGQIFPTMYKMDEDGHYHVALDYPRDRLVEVDGTGAGCLLVHRRVIERMKEAYPEPHPWFQEEVINGKDRGEDMTFCFRAKELGYRIIVNTGINLGHVKTKYLTETEYDRAAAADRFLITGTGRSGTGYAQRLLSRCLVPVGHEAVFNPQAIAMAGDGVPGWDVYRGEASWLAAPFMPLDMPTIQLVRNPLETLRSLVGIGFLARTNPDHMPYEDRVLETLSLYYPLWTKPTDDRQEIIDRNVRFMAEWSAIIEGHGIPRFRVEDLQDITIVNDLLFELTGTRHDLARVDRAVQEVPTNVNTRTRDESITWEDGGPLLKELAERWGYGLET